MPDLGVALACGPATAVELAHAAEAAHFGSVWTTEFSYRSATVPMAAIAVTTSRITIGSAIAYAFARSPAMTAAEARDIDELSDGRLILGLGSAQPRRVEDWLGVDSTDPPGHAAEVIQAIRALWRLDEGRIRLAGRHVRVDMDSDGQVPRPLRSRVPIMLAAVNPRMVAVAGGVADGIIAHPIMDAEALAESARPRLEAAAAEAGRTIPPRVAAMCIVVVDDDEDRARRSAAAQIAFYAQHRTYAPLMELYGFAGPAGRIRDAVAAGDWTKAVAAVTDPMVDRLAIAGNPQFVRGRITGRLAQADCDHLILHTPSMLLLRPASPDSAAADYREHVHSLIDVMRREPTGPDLTLEAANDRGDREREIESELLD